MKHITTLLAILVAIGLLVSPSKAAERPNVILVMTDDQGWGEVGFHGNDVIKTPNLNRFAAEGTELTNFYVSPMCTPTRSSLMTGRYHFRTGAHDTYIGRSNMKPSETTIAELFAGSGYRTGIFGKWHLGENFPFRAQDQGFEKVVVHGGGGIGQFADYPGNTYWDPTLQYNDTFKKAKGYCTDVFIDESIEFIKNSDDKPFFCYLPLNVPHSPFEVATEFRDDYDKQKLADPDGRKWVAPIYGMITHFDSAFARLLGALEEMGQRENTIVIFMSDNGPNSTYFTAGLRAKKGSVYENGIRSPFVIQWPKVLKGDRKFNMPAMHIDLLPTLADACGIALPDELDVDGESILGLLKGESSAAQKFQQRTLFMQHNRGNLPTKYKNGMARRGPWKAVGNRGEPTSFELYNIQQDPGEKQNLAAKHPEMVKSFVQEYEAWFDDVTAELQRDGGMPSPFDLNPQQKLDFRFTWQDWWGDRTGWRPNNYGRWRMSNRGLIDRFDVTVVPHRQHQRRTATVKFIWMDRTIVKKFDSVPTQVELSDIKLPKGTGFMEAQLHIGNEMHAVQEVRIRAHGVVSSLPAVPASRTRTASKPRTVSKDPIALPEVRGQFVRIELPGKNRVLSLAEVAVYENQKNVAQKKHATQSSIGFGGSAERAVDGNTDGNYHHHSVSHTEIDGTNAWWEVDLGGMVNVEQIVVSNRTDAAQDRLDGFTLRILNAEREVLFSKEQVAQAPVISFLRPGVQPSQNNGEERVEDFSSYSFPGVKSDFRGYERYDRIKTSAGHFAVVCPKKPAPGKPWLWRSMFWEAIKKVSDADLKLVDEGYHVVIAHGDVAGHPSGNANIDAAYDMLTTKYGFSKKCANMSSMSRGTLSLFRWASANPNKVDSIYVDNGVCNVLSWPAGKLVPGSGSKASGAPGSWEDFKRKFGYTTDAEAIKTKESPIDQLEPLAKAGVPILMVCGNKDHAVPYEENDAIMEQRYQALGGNIKVIVENKGHSHGMNDPTPVLEFIRRHTSAEPTPTTDQSSVEAVPTGQTIAFSGQEWIVDTQNEWQSAIADQFNLEIKDGVATPTADEASFRSVLITSDEKRSAKSLTIEQSPVWRNWKPIPNLGPSNLGDAPVMLTVGPGNYWMFGRYGRSKKKDFKSETATLEGFDIPLKTTPFPNQYDAPGGLKKGLGGYHAWQSRDMINWVHHGPVTEAFSSWVTTAEYADGKLYLYYDYPNDQDPHLYIDDDLTDGVPGRNHGMAFKDPSHGSDCAFIRDLQGNFHVIYEDWSPIDASKHSWDSPLAGHAISKTGMGDFKILPPAVDVRTKPTGKFAEYPHPHWHATDPKNYPGKPAPEDVPQHRIKKGEVRAFAKYEIHEPEQDAFGDWASICIGGQYYLFADYHPAKSGIRVGWFTSSSLDKPFTFCGEIGKGHPDPDIMFAEGRFYLATQMSKDYVSPGPWVETVKARVGVDIDNDKKIDQWTDWTEVKETYDYIKGFSKQIAKSPAKLDLTTLPEGYGFQYELRLSDSTENPSKPIIKRTTLSYK